MGATAHSTEPQCCCPSTSLSPAPDVSKVAPLASPASLSRAGHGATDGGTLGSLTGCSDCLKLLSDLKVLTPCLEPNPVLPRGNRALLLQVWDVLAGFGVQQLQALRMLSRASKHPSLTPLHIPVCAALDVPVINHVLSVKSQQAKIEP